MADAVECVVIGGGVVGLAVARALALAGREVLVLEQERWIGAHTSSRNSEVIHAGLYYPKDSLKARYLRRGPHPALRLLRRARRAAQAHRQARRRLHRARDSGAARRHGEGGANGVRDLAWLGGNEARALEPELSCLAAFHSPSTGIIDSHGLMLAYRGRRRGRRRRDRAARAGAGRARHRAAASRSRSAAPSR